MENVDQTIISQYSVSPSLNLLIEAFNQWVDPKANIEAFFDQVWNIDTAVGYGLDVWGRILGIGRVIAVASTKYWGYAEATSVSADPYGQSPFYSGEKLTDNVILDDEGFRTLLLAKAAANICNGSIEGINAILLMLYPGRGNVYVVDGRDMTMQYKFEFEMTPLEISIAQGSGVLPKPAGVLASVVQEIHTSSMWDAGASQWDDRRTAWDRT
jgi:hypothetical protein